MSIFDIEPNLIDMTDLLYKYDYWMSLNRTDPIHGYIILIGISEMNNEGTFDMSVDFIDGDEYVGDFECKLDEYHVKIIVMRMLYRGMGIYGINTTLGLW